MAAQQRIFRIRRSYNQWVNNQTLEDYALRFTAIGSRRWSLQRVSNTALGAISFLALEAIGGAITLNYGFTNAAAAIGVVSLLIFLLGIPICYYAARDGVDIDLLTRGAGFGYIGSTATSLIYASFTFIFFALEAAIMAKALELMLGLPMVWGYIVSSVVVIPLVFYGITFISRFQLWSQPLWITLQVVPLVIILYHDFALVEQWQNHSGLHQKGETGFNILLFGAAASVMFALVAQIGEQVDFLRFLPEKTTHNRLAWWAALLAGGPGWVIVGALKLFAGSFLAYVALSQGKSLLDAADPTTMYTMAFSYLTHSPQAALILAGVFVIVSQLKINVTNAYAGSIAWSNFFSRLTHSHPGRVVWLVFNVCIALLLMELGVYHAFEKTLSVYAVVAVAWVGALVADLTINKPLGLSPKHIEFKRAYLHDLNPVGVGSVAISSVLGIICYLGLLGPVSQALAHFIALAAAFVLAPAIALLTGGKYYLARSDLIVLHPENVHCCVCENTFEPPDMAFCPAYEGAICSLCCSLDSRCRDSCKSPSQFSAQLAQALQKLVPTNLGEYINVRLVNVMGLALLIGGVAAALLALIYSNSLTPDDAVNTLIAQALWKVFFILMIIAGIITWLFTLAHESRIVAQEESQRQNRLLVEEIEAHEKTDLALQKAKEKAEAANNAKSRYLTGISHELRTPLNSILGYAQLLEKDERIHGYNKHQVEVIRRSAEHLTDLIEGLLDISKIEAGRLEIQTQVFDLPTLMDQLVDMFALQAQERGLKFEYKPLTPLPKLVQGDEKRVRQILINLLSNAIKFTARGAIDFSIRYRNEVAEIRIRDTGVGIPVEEMERIFRPFERIRLPGVPATNGTGLGLTITRLLVDIMGGDINVQQNPDGAGVTFSVSLMLARVFRPQQQVVQVRRIYGYEGHVRTLMVVDDDAAHRGLLHELLAPLGFVVVEAPDAFACLNVVKNFTPSAFLIDRCMPGMDGPDLAHRLRHQGFRQPIIMVSANASEDLSRKDLNASYDDYFIKPVRLDHIVEKLGQHLQLAWRYQPQADQAVPADPSTEPTRLPPQSIVEELIGWAEVGALGKVRALVEELELRQLASDNVIAKLKHHVLRVELSSISETLKVCQW